MEKNDLKNLLQRKVSEYMSTNVLLLNRITSYNVCYTKLLRARRGEPEFLPLASTGAGYGQ